MEQQLPNDNLLELQVDYEAGAKFKESAKWGQFIAVIYFIALGFFLLMLTFGSAMLIEMFSKTYPMVIALGGMFIVICFVVAAVYVFVAIQLYRYCTLVRTAVERQDIVSFHDALRALKTYFMVSGIIGILGLAWSLFSLFKKL